MAISLLDKKRIRRNDDCLCGSGKKYKKCCMGKNSIAEEVNKIFQKQEIPEVSISSENIKFTDENSKLREGINCFIQGDYTRSYEIAAHITNTNKNNSEAWHLLAAIHIQIGKIELAHENAKKALSLNDRSPSFHNTMANILRSQGKWQEAILEYEKAVELGIKNNSELYKNIGICLQELFLYEEAIEYFDKSLSLAQNGLVYLFKAECLIHTTNKSEALKYVNNSFVLLDKNEEIYTRLGNIYSSLEMTAEAEASYKSALALNSDCYPAQLYLADIAFENGEYASAKKMYHDFLQKNAIPGIKVLAATILPSIVQSNTEIDELRKNFIANLDELIKEKLELQNPVQEVRSVPFFQAYHGKNDKEIMQKMAEFYESACPSLLYVAPHCKTKPKTQNEKLRIGFVSQNFYNHSVGRFVNNIIEKMNEYSQVETYVFSAYSVRDFLTEKLSKNCTKYIELKHNFEKAREEIVQQELDILVYPDIGMGPFNYFMAFARLAPVQCVLGGHPVTTGINNIDYFIADNLCETENSDSHYSEKLVRLKSNPGYYQALIVPDKFDSRKELGLDEKAKLYICPMYLQKIHPDFDSAIIKILQKDNNARIIFFKSKEQNWHDLLLERFKKTIPADLLTRIDFIPHSSHEQFIHYLKAADVLLDTFHFGGGTTNYAAFLIGAPIVTLPGEFLRGRATYGMYKRMGINDAIAKDTDDYANIAVKIANNEQYKNILSQRILSANSVLFENDDCIKDLLEFFGGLFNQKIEGRKKNNNEYIQIARQELKKAITQAPIDKQMENALASYKKGDYSSSEKILQKLLKEHPQNPHVLNALGSIYTIQKKYLEASEIIKKSIEVDKDNIHNYNTLGIVLRELGKYEDSVTTIKKAINLAPKKYAEFYTNLGTTYRALGIIPQAKELYEQAIEINSLYWEAHIKLASLLASLNQHEKALQICKNALALNPNHSILHNVIGLIYQETGHLNDAIKHYENSIYINKDSVEVMKNLCNAYYLAKDFDTAFAKFQEANRIFDNNGLKINTAFLMPQIIKSKEDIDNTRNRIFSELNKLDKNGITLQRPEIEITSLPYYQIYHARNDKDLLVKVAELFTKACPSLLYTAPHCVDYKKKSTGEKIKIGFISSNFYNHSVGKAFNPLIAKMAKEKDIEVFVFSAFTKWDDYTKKLSDSVGNENFISLPDSVSMAREIIAKYELDAILYLDIGMEIFTYFLAFSRLAPVQATSGGHPTTSGIKNIDYFITTDKIETENAQEHYIEKLARFANNPVFYNKPSIPEKFLSRKELSLPVDKTLYICPMALQKIHPDFDDAIAKILHKDKNGIAIFFQQNKNNWGEILSNRFKKSIPDVADRIMFVPFTVHERFCSILNEADVILDSFHFGGGTTNYVAFALGKPMVTLPGEFLRGRATYGMYHQMGILEPIAKNIDDFVELVIKFANDKKLSKQIGSKIKERCDILFERQEIVIEMKEFFKKALASY